MVNKVMEFFHQLPTDEQKKWNEYYKKECVQWLKEVASDDEISELKKLESGSDKDQLATKVFSYLTRLSGEKMAKVEIWKVRVCSGMQEVLSQRSVHGSAERPIVTKTSRPRQKLQRLRRMDD
ncbi:unnamed protein product [Nippostrongylus brasiliensis]|uniref:NPA domain-containing protein n=1 Tax=Nippostrongylus brasiliensis TaxID=27835 RepID=A0A0N4XJ63_NIPBR|nr:unnamed protein product [Nippostrongylus brasiliensis]